VSRLALIALLVLLAACASDSVRPSEPEPTAAVLELHTSTRGAPPDPDGYLLRVDGAEGTVVALNDTLSLPDIAAGEHRVELTGVAENCVLSGPNPRTIVAVAGAVTRVDLAVRCSAPTGELRIEVSTAGIRPDIDGYVVAVNGSEQPIGPDATLTVSDLPPGDIEVRLAGIAPNCRVSGDNPRTATVTVGATAVATFAIECAGSAEGRLLVTSDRGGATHLYRLEEDGSDLRDLTPAQEAFTGDWSPDGSRIVFSAVRDGGVQLFVMTADGSDGTALGVAGDGPRWSPDGRRVAFTDGEEIVLVDPDGTNRRDLGQGRHPDWSPDGSRIVFDRIDRLRCVADLACPVELFVMAADGTGVRRITMANNASDVMMNPRWSPDGTGVAYTRRCCFLGANVSGLYVVGANGSLPRRIYAGPVRGGVAWSPDGASIAAAVGAPDGTTDILAVPRAGGRETVLLATPGSDFPQAWR
jgi:Tol biopolymer transport system component